MFWFLFGCLLCELSVTHTWFPVSLPSESRLARVCKGMPLWELVLCSLWNETGMGPEVLFVSLPNEQWVCFFFFFFLTFAFLQFFEVLIYGYIEEIYLNFCQLLLRLCT